MERSAARIGGRLPISRRSREEIRRICAANLLSDVPELILYFMDLDSRFVLVSRGQVDNLGALSADDVIGKSDADYFSSEHAERAYADEQEVIRTGKPRLLLEERQTFPDRPDNWTIASKFPLRDDDGTVIGTFGTSRDITRLVLAETAALQHSEQLRAANAELRRVEQELRSLVEHSPDVIVKVDADLRVVYANPRAAELFGIGVDEPLGRTNRELARGMAPPDVWDAALTRVLATGAAGSCEVVHAASGEPRHFHCRLEPLLDDEGAVVAVLAACRDITERKRAEDELAYLAVHDALTGLGNRVLVLDRLTHAVAMLEQRPGIVGLLFLDVDGFKRVNDTLGHLAGDAVLRAVADRLQRVTRPTDTVGRFGGDEFVVLCDSLDDEQALTDLAARVSAAVGDEPVVVDGTPVAVSVSIGAATCTHHRRGPDDVIREADAAMYAMKLSRRPCPPRS